MFDDIYEDSLKHCLRMMENYLTLAEGTQAPGERYEYIQRFCFYRWRLWKTERMIKMWVDSERIFKEKRKNHRLYPGKSRVIT